MGNWTEWTSWIDFAKVDPMQRANALQGGSGLMHTVVSFRQKQVP